MLFLGQMNRQALDRVAPAMQGETQEAPGRLRSTDIAAVEEVFDFVATVLQAGSIRPLYVYLYKYFTARKEVHTSTLTWQSR